jgi:electron transfer flavoprotein alpha subunit
MILVLIEHLNGKIKKSSLEAASFAAELVSGREIKVAGLIAKGAQNLSELGNYGIEEIFEYSSGEYLDSQQFTELLNQVVNKLNPDLMVLSNNSLGKAISGRLSVKLNRGLIGNVVQFKYENDKPIFKKSVFSGKAFAWYSFPENKGIVSVMPHGFGVLANKNKQVTVSTIDIDFPESKVKLKERNLIKGKTPLTEADIVVSGGRGLKDPSNWGMIEELAEILHATTACSRPVADAGWRPHHEHVGQTGIAIRPNVYIAIGISGAIQHLAGVNNSKKIVVINKDPEAPFFKAADYGICGDLFEIIPKLNEALKKAK